ncbi:porin family protein [Maribellus sp. CM-23]|uniref:outer membrane beta-barrel protein n=1 Tax=Maribellus sp. CM-23 TaxID=2781026 RepID=UPI001F29C11F|nr:outer membrane beta-barrel protein [Maribellus sp. CM-23]MCE4564533.1 porin family protein [Maribellus sp. CM-23]
MRHLLTLITMLLVSAQAFSQNANELKVYYGIAHSKILVNKDLNGAPGYDNDNTYEFGFKYLNKLTERFGIETGINYLHSRVEITPAFTGTPVNSHFENLNLLSIPILANYTFGKYFFVNGGPLIDFQLSDASFDSQSGIGYSLGIGAKYHFDRFLIFLNPNFKRHALIPFTKEDYPQKLTEWGLQLGIGYTF